MSTTIKNKKLTINVHEVSSENYPATKMYPETDKVEEGNYFSYPSILFPTAQDIEDNEELKPRVKNGKLVGWRMGCKKASLDEIKEITGQINGKTVPITRIIDTNSKKPGIGRKIEVSEETDTWIILTNGRGYAKPRYKLVTNQETSNLLERRASWGDMEVKYQSYCLADLKAPGISETKYRKLTDVEKKELMNSLPWPKDLVEAINMLNTLTIEFNKYLKSNK